MKTVITVSRNWDNPEIKVSVSNDSIGMEMSLDDFLCALSAEVGNPTMLFSSSQLLEKCALRQ